MSTAASIIRGMSLAKANTSVARKRALIFTERVFVPPAKTRSALNEVSIWSLNPVLTEKCHVTMNFYVQ